MILPGIHSLEQHLEHLVHQPESYRPQRCPHCGKAGVWSHGRYERKAPPGEGLAFSLNPLGIPRFRCPHCQRTPVPLCGLPDPPDFSALLVVRLLKVVDRSSPKEKRDYSILLLACRLGLRVGDISSSLTNQVKGWVITLYLLRLTAQRRRALSSPGLVMCSSVRATRMGQIRSTGRQPS